MSNTNDPFGDQIDLDHLLTSRILDHISQGAFWKNRDLVYVGCNAALADIVGLTDPDEICGKTDYDLPWLRQDAEAYRADDRAVIESGQAMQHLREPLQRADGKRIWVETTKVPVRDAADRVIGVFGLCIDMTRHRRQEQDLRETRHMLQSVLDTIPARVFWKDRESVYLGCNLLFARDAGLEAPRQIVGRTDHELGWAEQAQLYRADDRAVMETDTPKVGYEEPQTTPEGERIWLRTSKIPLRDADGGIIGVLGTYEDITESKRAEEEQRRLEAQIQHAQKLESLGILAGGIAHDFNNLLTAVLGYADLALTDMAPAGPGRPHVEEIRRAALRARDLTNQMLAYSGKGHFVVERLQLGDVLNEMGTLLESAIPKKTSLRYALAENLPPVEVDVAQIHQVVMNLVTNAAEAIGERGGLITLATGRQLTTEEYLARLGAEEELSPGEYVFLEVSDDGTGMDEETRGRIFDPFFTTKFHGRGLGLAAVQGILRGHGGAITVYSEPGRGSTFKVLLPADAGRTADAQEADDGTTTAGAMSGTVLVVDDEASVLEVTTKMLGRCGLVTLTARDGIEALEIFRDRRDDISLIILDMTMPRMDGEETFRELRALAPDVRVILTSGYNEQDATNRFVGKGLAGFMQKPFTLGGLRRRLQELMEPGD